MSRKHPSVWITWTIAIVCMTNAVQTENTQNGHALVYPQVKSTETDAETPDTKAPNVYTDLCPVDDQRCKNDPFGFEAIFQLHAQIDDDQNGDVDREESNEFLRDDLKLSDGLLPRTDLHGSDDLISVHDLWELWTSSKAYRWSVDDVINWLTIHVELPQYGVTFRNNNINGQMLPRLTTFSSYPLLSSIGIKNPVHRQKLALKATDVVLFGPPKYGHSFIKDFVLATSVIVAVAGCYFAYFQHKRSQCHLQKVMKDLNALQKAEDALSQLQQQLKKAQTEQQMVVSAKHDVERKLKLEIETAKAEAERLRTQRETITKEQVSCLKLAEDELIQLRKALSESERQLQDHSSIVSSDLQQWLQLTYEVETNYFEAKRRDTEKQLKEAREMCDKIRKQKEKFFGSFHVAHTNTLDDTDEKIIKVRKALEDVKKDLQERSFRWKEIENICGFNIIINPGIPYLNTLLRRTRYIYSGGSLQNTKKRSSFFAVDDLDDISLSYLSQGNSNISADLHRVMSVPVCASQKVLPTLLRAGMQMSAVGVNLAGMNSSRGVEKEIRPVSLPLSECDSIKSFSSAGSFNSPSLLGNHSPASVGSVHAWPVVQNVASETKPDKTCKVPESNGYVYDGHENTWTASSASNGKLGEHHPPSFSLESGPCEGVEAEMEEEEEKLEEILQDFEEITSATNKQKGKRIRLPFSKLLKGYGSKEKSS